MAPNYRVRPATLNDLEEITALIVPKVAHDGFHDYFFPHQDRYPGDFYRWWRRYYRNHILKPYSITFVAVDEGDDIVGLSLWQFAPRGTNGEQDAPVPRGLPNIAKNTWFQGALSPHSVTLSHIHALLVIQRKVYALIDKVHDRLFPNRCLDPIAIQEFFGKVLPELREKLWTGKDRVHWLCPELFEPPSTTEKDPGVFTQWGMDRSETDNVTTFMYCRVWEREVWEERGFEFVTKAECGPSEWLIMRYPS
jgi:hypothetical protein